MIEVWAATESFAHWVLARRSTHILFGGWEHLTCRDLVFAVVVKTRYLHSCDKRFYSKLGFVLALVAANRQNSDKKMCFVLALVAAFRQNSDKKMCFALALVAAYRQNSDKKMCLALALVAAYRQNSD